MKQCPKCKKEYNDELLFCQECGTELEILEVTETSDNATCPKCHQKIDNDAAFCSNCGYQLNNKPEENQIKISPEEQLQKRSQIMRMIDNIFLLTIGILVLFGIFSPLLFEYSDSGIYIFNFFEKQFFDQFKYIHQSYAPMYRPLRISLLVINLLIVYSGLVLTLIFAIKGIIDTTKNLLNHNEQTSTKNTAIACIFYFGMIYSLFTTFASHISYEVSLGPVPSFILFLIITFYGVSILLKLLLKTCPVNGKKITSVCLRYVSTFFGLGSLNCIGGYILTIGSGSRSSLTFVSLPDFLITNGNSTLNYFVSICLALLGAATSVLICVSFYRNLNNLSGKSTKKDIGISIASFISMILLFIITYVFLSPIFNENIRIGHDIFTAFNCIFFAFGLSISGHILNINIQTEK